MIIYCGLFNVSEDARLNRFQLFTEIVETAYMIRDLSNCVLGDSPVGF